MRRNKNLWLNASATIEMCFILPIVIFIVWFLIYVSFFLYARTEASKDAYICALRGARMETSDNKEVYKELKEQSKSLLKERGLIILEYSEQISVKGNSIRVVYNIRQEIPYGGVMGLLKGQERWDILLERHIKRIHPVSFIRNYQKSKAMIGDVQNKTIEYDE